jgi:tetratricopeptide (TPR) repeat protein
MVRADVIRRTKFDPKLRYSEDSDCLFRLAMRTGFCYVSRPLVWFDRSPGEIRHVGVSTEWNKLEFVLQQSQIRLEGLLRLSEDLPKRICKVIREQLGSTHSGLANCYLEAGQYSKAREAVSRALQFDLTLNFAVKWLLTWMNPPLARRTVRRHLDRRTDSVPII